MNSADLAAFGALMRTDMSSFLWRCMRTLNPDVPFLQNWHIEAVLYQLRRVMRGEVTRLIINLPPRYLKSIMTSVVFPAYLLGHEPHRRIICLSYGADLADKHASDFRSIVQSHWYRRAFSKMQITRALESEVHTTRRGFRKATSVYGPLTGLGGDVFIIDDPQKAVDAQSDTQRNGVNDWFSTTLRSRLDNKATGIIIVVMQRVHLHDLSGYLLENGGEWTHLNLPAIAEADERVPIGDNAFHLRRAGEALHPAHEPLDVLERLRAEIGSEVFAAQYQQTPVPPGGAMIKRHWIRYYDKAPDRTYRTKIIQSWDTAAKAGSSNDWSVCTTWLVQNKDFYLLDLTRGRYEYPQLRNTAVALAEHYKPDTIYVEDASTGIALAQELRQARIYATRPVQVERDKIGRMYLQQSKFEAGQVLFPRGAHFLPVLEAELLTFPQSKTDDQVDSISQALASPVSKYGNFDSSYRWVDGE